MKKTVLAAAAAMICLNLVADMISLFGSNVEVHARSAASVTGPQAAVIASALQPESTNGWIVAAHQNWLTNETDAAALSAIGVHSNRVDNPHVVTAAQVGAPSVDALYTLMATSRIEKVWEGTNTWYTFASNIIVRHVMGYNSQSFITLSEDFSPTPAWYPIGAWGNSDDPVWSMGTAGPGEEDPIGYDYLRIYSGYPDYPEWRSTNGPISGSGYLTAFSGSAYGTAYLFASNVQSISETTNTLSVGQPLTEETWGIDEMTTWLATNTFSLAEARISALRLAPVVSNMYANLAVTNIAGYASFGTANPAVQQTTTVIPASAIATNTVGLRYDIGSDGFISAQAVTCARVGSGIESMSSTLTLRNSLGEPLASNVFYGVWSGSGTTWPYFTNSLVWSGTFLTNAYLTLTCTIAKTNTASYVCWIASGDSTPSTLAVTTTPLPYTTLEQLQIAVANAGSGYVQQTGGTLTNATLSGNVTIGGVTRTSWPDGGGGTGSVIIDAVTNAYGYTSAYIVTNLTSGGAVSTNFFTDRALVPQTGQTNVYFAFYCDGCLRKGFPLPTPRFAALAESGDATNQIRDLLTGLIWDRNAGRSAANLPAAYAVVSNMNAEVYGGANDWRLPNVKEAYSVLHLGYFTPAICNTAGTAKWSAGDPFNGVNTATSYSTSNTRIQNTNLLYAVGLGEGGVGLTAKQTTLYFWPVRGP